MTLLDAALGYAARGLHVFPCIGKKPRTRHGCKDATTDLEQIRRWWSDWPDANIGIATEPSSLVVIDRDDRYGGDENLFALSMELGIPRFYDEAPAVMTGGGHHSSS